MSNTTRIISLDLETRDLSDEEFSAAVAGVVTIRNARNEGTMEARQMAAATRGVSLRYEFRPRTAADVTQDLVNTYVRSGFTPAEAERRIRALR
jgi:hypothetical protein